MRLSIGQSFRCQMNWESWQFQNPIPDWTCSHLSQTSLLSNSPLFASPPLLRAAMTYLRLNSLPEIAHFFSSTLDQSVCPNRSVLKTFPVNSPPSMSIIQPYQLALHCQGFSDSRQPLEVSAKGFSTNHFRYLPLSTISWWLVTPSVTELLPRDSILCFPSWLFFGWSCSS